MSHLARLLYPLVATALAGTGAVAALALGYAALQPILLGAGMGALVAFPVTWRVAKALE